MTSRAEGETLTRTGPGTPMGNLMRQYWLPATKSSELVADGDPVRLMILGEKLIAFRDSSGSVGIMDHRCPHRCASLFFGRNEEDGIRCVYHGWKFDVEGNCVDMANVPPSQDFKRKVKAKAYKATERAGLVWVYMGDADNVPELPAIEATLLPEAEVTINFAQRECNWLQALERAISTPPISAFCTPAASRWMIFPMAPWAAFSLPTRRRS
jgi:phthalate 4,5-dioxygenase oxygenase subunit